MPLFQGSQATIHYEQSSEGPDIVWVSGAGGTAGSWTAYQLPFFKDAFRNTTFDCRGVGTTVSELPLPWSIEDFARDAAELIEGVCDPPVALVGLSFGAGIVQQVALDFPDLVRCAIAMGTGARSVGWTWDYSMAEIEWRKAGGRLAGVVGGLPLRALILPGERAGRPRAAAEAARRAAPLLPDRHRRGLADRPVGAERPLRSDGAPARVSRTAARRRLRPGRGGPAPRR